MRLGQVAADRDKTFAETLRPVSIVLALAYAVFAVAHAHILAPEHARWMTPIAALSSLALGALAVALGRWRPAPGYAHAVGACVGYVIAANAIPHVAISGRPEDSLNILMLILAAGGLVYSVPWLLCIVVPPLLAWLAIAYQAPSDPAWARFGFVLLSGFLLSVVLVVSRLRIHRKASESAALMKSAVRAQRDELQRLNRAERQMRESEFRYRLLADNARDVITYTGRDANVEYVSPSVGSMFGIDPDSLIGRNLYEVLAQLTGGQTGVALQNWPPEVDRTFELPARLADGTASVWEIRTAVVRNENGEFEGLHAAARDVSDRRKAEERLELARFALDSAGECVLRVGPSGEILDANATTEQQLGYTRRELLSMTIGDLHPGYYMDDWPDFWARLSASAPVVFESRQRARDGSDIPVELVVSRIGLHDQAIAFVRDIRVRLAAEESLRLSEERVRAMFDQTVIGMLILGRDGRHLRANAAMSRMLGYEPSELVGMGFAEITPREDRPSLTTRGRAALEGFNEVVRIERRYLRKDGSTFWTRTTRIPVLREGRAEYWVLIVEDITSELAAMAVVEETKQEAERAAEAKAEFLASIAHEVRTPMNAVVGMTQLLLGTELDERQREYASTIESSGAALLSVVEDLLDFSRSETGRLQVEDSDFDLVELASATIALFETEAAEKGLALGLAVEADAPTAVRGDPGRVRQVLTNLIANAVKFTDRGRVDVRIRTSAAARGDQNFDLATVRIEVQDTGIGIEKAQCDAIFAPFEQADAATQRRFGGSGLGLAICRNLCLAMGGVIGVESEPGVGSRFWFELPLVRDFALLGAGNQLTALDVSAAADALPILVAEDNPVNTRVMQHMLGKLGYRCVLAANGIEATAAANRQHFAAILLDCRMPIMDGYEAAMRIRATAATHGRQTPIIAVTANASPQDRERCIEAGMNDYLPKPITLGGLRSTLEKWIASSRDDAAPPEPDLDFREAIERAEGDVELVREVAALVHEHAPRLMRELQCAVEPRDWHTIELNAHSLKGQAAQVSAHRAAASAERVESIACARDEAELEAAVRDLEIETSLLVGVLAGLTKNSSLSA